MANGAGNTSQYVEAPPTTPMPFGLFSAATVIDDPLPVRWSAQGITWEPAYCGPAEETAVACTDPGETGGFVSIENSVHDGIDAVEASAMTAFHLFRCRLPGGAWDRGEERAAEALRLGEQRAVEKHLMATMARVNMDGDTAVYDLTGSLTGDSSVPVHPVTGLGLLHEFAGANYGGTPVIHMGPLPAVLLRSYGAIERVGAQLQTAIGGRVAVGSGYERGLGIPEDSPGGTAIYPPVGSAYMYATGQVMVRRAPTEVTKTLGGSMIRNEFVALAERPYVVGWECFTACVLVDLSYGVPV